MARSLPCSSAGRCRAQIGKSMQAMRLHPELGLPVVSSGPAFVQGGKLSLPRNQPWTLPRLQVIKRCRDHAAHLALQRWVAADPTLVATTTHGQRRSRRCELQGMIHTRHKTGSCIKSRFGRRLCLRHRQSCAL